MDDQFLKKARQEPRPEFAHSLRERLRGQEAVATDRTTPARRFSPAVTAFAGTGTSSVECQSTDCAKRFASDEESPAMRRPISPSCAMSMPGGRESSGLGDWISIARPPSRR